MIQKIAVVTNAEEYNRFTKKIIDCDILIIHEKPSSYFNILNMSLSESEFYFIGARAPDIYLISNIINRCKQIHILQHAFNKNYSKVSIYFLYNNFCRFVAWFVSIIIGHIFKFKRKVNSDVYCYYFTNYYKLRIGNVYPNITFYSCSKPDPTVFGTSVQMNKNLTPINYFYVDEPLTKTLGLTNKSELQLICNLINQFKIKKLYVKLHPRSNKFKFSKIKQVYITESIYQNSKHIIGFKSNLLKFNFNSKYFIGLDKKDLSWKLNKRKSFEVGTYIEDVKNIMIKNKK